MSDALEHIRYSCGIAGEEVANYVDQLQAKVAELEAENAKLHEQVDLQVPKMAFTQLKEQLAAEQLNSKRLRDALEVLAKLGNGDRYGNSEGNVIAQQALASPSDTSALDAYVAEKVKEAKP